MKKLVLTVFVFVLVFMFAGCGTGNKNLRFARLEIYMCDELKFAEKHAICEIEEEMTTIMLTDFSCLDENKIINLCNSVCVKWGVESKNRVLVEKENLYVKIWFGDNAHKSSVKEIMLPI